MIECYVNSIRLYPNVESDIIIVKSNTSLNKSGSHSMEIIFPLSEPENAKFFKHQNRIGSKENKRVFDIILKADGIKVLNGSLQIIAVDDKEVRTQATEGELSAAVNVEKCSIRDLDLGEFDKFSREEANDLENKYYPETDYCFPFILVRDQFERDMDISNNPYDMLQVNKAINTRHNKRFQLGYAEPDVAQIYFLAIIERIFANCGYRTDFTTFFQNEENNVFKKLYIVSGLVNNERWYQVENANIKISHILPDWTVSQFLNEVRTFLNVSFEFEGKVVKLVPRKNILREKEVIIKEKDIVKGEYIPEFEYVDDEENDLVGYLNFGYDSEDSEFNKFQNIDKRVMNNCRIVDVSQKDNYPINALVLYQEDNEAHTKFCKVDEREWQRCATMQDFVQNDSEEIRKSKIVPAEIEECKIQYFNRTGSSLEERTNVVKVFVIAPKTKTYSEKGISGNVLGELIREGVKEEYKPQRIEVAFIGKYVEKGWEQEYPGAIEEYSQKQSHVWPRYEEEVWADGDEEEAVKMNLSPSYMYHTYYENTYKADFSKEYKITFLAKSYPDPTSIFLINNVKFCCKEYKIYLVKGKNIGMVEGVFFKMKN